MSAGAGVVSATTGSGEGVCVVGVAGSAEDVAPVVTVGSGRVAGVGSGVGVAGEGAPEVVSGLVAWLDGTDSLVLKMLLPLAPVAVSEGRTVVSDGGTTGAELRDVIGEEGALVFVGGAGRVEG